MKDTVADEGSALDHSFTNYVSNNDATCTADGTKTAKCDRCEVKDTVADEGSALDHDYKSVVTAPTCEAEGYTTYTCARCSDSYKADKIAAKGHDYEGVVTTPATCTENGVKTYTCKNDASHTYTEVINKTGHTAGAEATCTTAQICTVCKAELVAKLGHAEVVHDGKDATCEEGGYKAYVTCSRCDYTTYEAIEKLEHDYKSVVTAPTCEAKGYTTHTCSRCGDSYVDTYVNAAEHSLGEYIIDKAATCTEAGSKHKECANCDYKTEAEVIEKLEHSYTGEFIYSSETKTHAQKCVYGCGTYSESTPCTFGEGVKFEPNCANDGYVLHTCSVCSGSYKTDVIPASGHEWGTLEHIEGTDTHKRICAINAEHSEVVTCVTANRYIAPTCTKEGLSEDICTECNYKYNSNKVSAYGHRYINEDGKENAVVVAPGCTTQGSKYLVCVLCDAKTEPTAYGTPKGHQLYIEKGYGATCTENGYTDYEYCLREGCSYVKEPETIKATGHNDNGSGTCVNCSKPLYEGGSKACNCMCHSDSFIIKFIYKIVLFFWKLFRIKADCACGGIHY